MAPPVPSSAPEHPVRTGEEGGAAPGPSLSSASALQEQACEKEKLHFPPLQHAQAQKGWLSHARGDPHNLPAGNSGAAGIRGSPEVQHGEPPGHGAIISLAAGRRERLEAVRYHLR